MSSPQSPIANRHFIRSPHTLSPLNDDVSHGYTLCTPSMMMAINDYCYHGPLQSTPPQWLWIQHDNRRWLGNCFCTKGWLAWLADDCQKDMRRCRIIQYITTLDPSSAQPLVRHFSCSLFNDILTPPHFNTQQECSLLEVGKTTYLSTHIDKCLLEGVIR